MRVTINVDVIPFVYGVLLTLLVISVWQAWAIVLVVSCPAWLLIGWSIWFWGAIHYQYRKHRDGR